MKLLASALFACAALAAVVPARGAERLRLAYHFALPIRNPFIERFAPGRAPEVDLRPQIRAYHLAIRDQGNRGTCTVFATTFLIEYQKAAMSAPGPHMLSEEYLNWAANEVNGTPYFDGGTFTKMIPGFNTYGISGAGAMPYQPSYDASSPDTPSAMAKKHAAAMFPQRYPFTFLKNWDDTTGLTPAEFQRYLSTLRSGHPIATGIWWLSNFATLTVDGVPLLKFYPRSANTGSSPPMFDGHSIDLVGFKQSTLFPGGGYFIFRNSFGPSFGSHGYGFVSFQYIRTYANDGITIPPQPWTPSHPIIPRSGGKTPI